MQFSTYKCIIPYSAIISILEIHMPVHFFFLQQNTSLQQRQALKRFIASIFTKEKKRLQNLNYIFCSDDALLEINRRHLQHDYYTDIITFDLSENAEAISGEIYISTDRVRDNAKQLGKSINEELHRVIFHGVLHLCGYKDKSPKQSKQMRSAEDRYLQLYFK
jgi:probable rRNA maturation factor